MNFAHGPAGGSTIQVLPSHYQDNYDHRRRFVSYFNQVNIVRKAKAQKVLEIGIGNGFLSRYLRENSVDLHTVDFDERLRPDTVASVTNLPFPNGSFDTVCCFETLEHLPWDAFVPAVTELVRVSSRKVLLSLPDVTPFFRIRLGYSFNAPSVNWCKDYYLPFPPKHEFDGQHYWEIGKRSFPKSKIIAALEGAGLRVKAAYRDYEDPFHRFFDCEIATDENPARAFRSG
jgi:SAM-dependent methyltransferase